MKALILQYDRPATEEESRVLQLVIPEVEAGGSGSAGLARFVGGGAAGLWREVNALGQTNDTVHFYSAGSETIENFPVDKSITTLLERVIGAGSGAGSGGWELDILDVVELTSGDVTDMRMSRVPADLLERIRELHSSWI